MSAIAFCTVAASTKRGEDLGDGITGAAVAYLAEVMITPLWPVTPETAMSEGLSSPREYKECYHVPVDGGTLPDIVEGDILTVAAVDYIVDSVAEWGDIAGGVPSLRIVAQEVKRAWAGA